MVSGAKPKDTGGILINRPYLFMLQRFSGGIMKECVAMPVTQPLVCANPDIPIAVFENASCAEVRKPVFYPVFLNPLRCNPAYAFIGPDPHIAVARLKKYAD